MAILDIRKYPDPVLKKRTSVVEAFDAKLQRLIDDMLETMYAAPGVGLAANQVGVSLRLAVIDVSGREENGRGHPLLVLVNPELLAMEGSVVEEEGCLSIPEFSEKVKRAAKVKVRAQDRTGRHYELDAEGLLAKALQHEIDHLNGMLFVDRLSPLKRDLFKRRLRKVAMQKD
jgi:peptide deformylase